MHRASLEDQSSNRYMALTSNDCDIPALFVDTQAPLDVLLEAADHRIRAVTQVMESLAMAGAIQTGLLPGISIRC